MSADTCCPEMNTVLVSRRNMPSKHLDLVTWRGERRAKQIKRGKQGRKRSEMDKKVQDRGERKTGQGIVSVFMCSMHFYEERCRYNVRLVCER